MLTRLLAFADDIDGTAVQIDAPSDQKIFSLQTISPLAAAFGRNESESVHIYLCPHDNFSNSRVIASDISFKDCQDQKLVLRAEFGKYNCDKCRWCQDLLNVECKYNLRF
jgi:hypothetical protein